MSDVIRSLAKAFEGKITRPPPAPPPPRPRIAIQAVSSRAPEYSPPTSAPAVQDGYIRLYRAEAVPPGPAAPMPEWVTQARNGSGAEGATGRWFTDTPSTLGFYLQDQQPHGRVFYLDLPSQEAEALRVRNYQGDGGVVDPRSFSRDQDTEFFLPRDLAMKKALLGP